MLKTFKIFSVLIIIYSSLQGQSLFDSVIIKKTNNLVPNHKITYAFNYCEKNLIHNPDEIFAILTGIKSYLTEHSTLNRWGTYHYHLAEYYFMVDLYDSAYANYSKALAYEPDLSSITIAKCKLKSTYLLLLKNETKLAKKLIVEIVPSIQKINNKRLYGLYFKQEAFLNTIEENYSLASSQFQKALTYYRESEDTLSIAFVYSDIAFMYTKIGDHLLAIDYHDKAENIFRQETNKRLLAKNQFAMGDAFYLAAQYNNALARFVSAETIFTRLHDTLKITEIHLAQGKTYQKLQNFNQALLYLNKALNLIPSNVSNENKANILASIGDVYSDLEQRNKAIQFYSKSLDISINIETKINLYKKLSNNYLKLNNYKMAYKFQVLYNGLNSKILNDKIDKTEEQLNLKVKKEILEHENEKIILQKELSILIDSKKANATLYQIIIVMLLFAIITLSIFYIRLLKRKNKDQNKLLNTIDIQRKNISKNTREIELIRNTSGKILNMATKNMWEPFWVLENLSSQLLDQNESLDDAKQTDKSDNDQLIMARNLLENVLYWAKNEQKDLQYHPEKLSVSKILHPIIQTQKIRAAVKEITLQYKQYGAASIYADKQTTQVALRNIIENAVKFSTLNGEITVIAQKSNNKVEIIISDNGVGMTKDQVNALFSSQKPYQASGTHGEKGVGLGLSLAKEFIERNFGQLAIESSIALGTKVTITLPSELYNSNSN